VGKTDSGIAFNVWLGGKFAGFVAGR